MTALALTTGFVASASAVRREARRHLDTASALESASLPGPDATEDEVSAWVRRVESILRPVVSPEDES